MNYFSYLWYQNIHSSQAQAFIAYLFQPSRFTVNNRNSFKNKFNKMFFSLHQEILKTSAIGKKLLTAGRTNSHLKETYEELGRIIEQKVERGELNIDDSKIRSLLHTIQACKKDLKEIEEQVNRIKFSPSPEDISKRLPPRDDE